MTRPADRLVLNAAAANGELEAVKAWLAEHKDYEQDDLTAALWRAAGHGHLGMMRFLAGEGADVDGAAAGSNTILMRAVMRESDEVVATLVDLGADLELKGAGGHTALEYAEQRGFGAIADILREGLRRQEARRAAAAHAEATRDDRHLRGLEEKSKRAGGPWL